MSIFSPKSDYKDVDFLLLSHYSHLRIYMNSCIPLYNLSKYDAPGGGINEEYVLMDRDICVGRHSVWRDAFAGSGWNNDSPEWQYCSLPCQTIRWVHHTLLYGSCWRVCQMLPKWTKNGLIPIWIYPLLPQASLVPLFSVFQASYNPTFTLLACDFHQSQPIWACYYFLSKQCRYRS